MVQAGSELIYHPELISRSVGVRSDHSRHRVLTPMGRARASNNRAGRPTNMKAEPLQGLQRDGRQGHGIQGTEVSN